MKIIIVLVLLSLICVLASASYCGHPSKTYAQHLTAKYSRPGYWCKSPPKSSLWEDCHKPLKKCPQKQCNYVIKSGRRLCDKAYVKINLWFPGYYCQNNDYCGTSTYGPPYGYGLWYGGKPRTQKCYCRNTYCEKDIKTHYKYKYAYYLGMVKIEYPCCKCQSYKRHKW